MSEKNTTINKSELEELENKKTQTESVINDLQEDTKKNKKNNENSTSNSSEGKADVEEASNQTSGDNAKDDIINEEETPSLSDEEKLKLEVEVQKDKYLRLFAEFENYKRRTSKERIEMFKTAGQEVIQSMLPVLDDFDRALKEVSKSKDDDAIKGVELIYNKLKDTLKAKGLEVFHVNEGDAFDSDLHEAITQIPAPQPELKGKIIDVVEKGYTLGDKIIRYPKVVTGK